MENEMPTIYKRRKHPFLFAPDDPLGEEENPVCTLFERCNGCPYPHHGFICWSRDGSCLRTDMQRINQRQEDAQHG